MDKKIEIYSDNLDDESTDMFDAVRNARNIALMSCFVNGEPATAIVCINEQVDGNLNVQPLYVSITPSMVLTDHDGTPATVDPQTVN